jgi:CRP-like cAMP-binding protein
MAQKIARSRTSSRPPPDGNGQSLQNEILISLPSAESSAFLPKLTLISLKLHDVFLRHDETIDFVYFPNTAMASVLSSMENGKSIEVGLVGKEGFVGLPLFAGFRTSPHLVVTQGPGTAYRISAQDFKQSLASLPELQKTLLRYSQRFLMQTTQIAACNRLHEGDERLARWLLMTQDRVGTPALPLTQEFLGQMLGSRRASVSISASTLQKAGLISYSHGKITILDREGLEQASCECYEVLWQQWDKWKRETS